MGIEFPGPLPSTEENHSDRGVKEEEFVSVKAYYWGDA